MIELKVGQPKFRDNPAERALLASIIASPSLSFYPVIGGNEMVRSAVANYYARLHGIAVAPNQTLITSGARPAIIDAAETANARTRNIGWFSPFFHAFKTDTTIYGFKPWPVTLPNQPLSQKVLIQLLSPLKGGVFIMNNPQNPTGRIFEEPELMAMANVAKLLDIKVISDAVYLDIYDPDVKPPTSFLKFSANCVEIMSMSKSYHSPGMRVGSVAGDQDWIDRIKRRISPTNGIHKHIQNAAAHLWETSPGLAQYRDEISQRRDTMIDGLLSLGFEIDRHRQNRAGIFVWARIPHQENSSNDLIVRMKNAGVEAASGTESGASGFIRFSLNEPTDVLHEAIKRIKTALENKHDVAA